MTPIAAETIVWFGAALATAFLFVVGFLVVYIAFLAVFDGGEDDVLDVQRFIALTEEARSVVPPGLPLFDADKAAAATAAIERFRVKKDEARRALWESRSRRRD